MCCVDWGWIGIPDGVAGDVGDGVEMAAETTAESGGSDSVRMLPPAVPGLLLLPANPRLPPVAVPGREEEK